MTIKAPFEASTDADAAWRREGLPNPGKLAHLGIRTKESLDWMAARQPQAPAPEPSMPDPGIESQARDEERRSHRERINRLRSDFKNGSIKTRRDFGTAHDYRGREKER